MSDDSEPSSEESGVECENKESEQVVEESATIALQDNATEEEEEIEVQSAEKVDEIIVESVVEEKNETEAKVSESETEVLVQETENEIMELQIIEEKEPEKDLVILEQIELGDDKIEEKENSTKEDLHIEEQKEIPAQAAVEQSVSESKPDEDLHKEPIDVDKSDSQKAPPLELTHNISEMPVTEQTVQRQKVEMRSNGEQDEFILSQMPQQPSETMIIQQKRERVENQPPPPPPPPYQLETQQPTQQDEDHGIDTSQPCSVQDAIAQFNKRPPQEIEKSRVVLNAVPAMNSHSNDSVIRINEQFQQFSMQANERTPIQPRRANPPQSSIYQRNVQETPRVMNPNYQAPIQRPSRNLGPEPVKHPDPYMSDGGMQSYAAAPSTQRKLSATTPYIGSHVIASETGPSLTVLLRRPASERQWGFTFYGGAEYGCPPFVNKVLRNSLAFQNGLEVGDVIVSICKTLAVGKTHEQLKAEILRAGNDLDLVLIRRGVDLNKLNQMVPHIVPTTTGLVASSGPFGGHMPSPGTNGTVVIRPRAGQSLPRGRSFRNIKTKSVRILEEQLASGQIPSSVLTTKQHFQGARGLPAAGASSSFSRAYGQSDNAGYSGRAGMAQVPSDNAIWTTASVVYATPSPSVVSANYNQSTYRNEWSGTTGIVQPREKMLRPVYTQNWETQSDRGHGQWTAQTQPASYNTPQMQYSTYAPPAYATQAFIPNQPYSNIDSYSVPPHQATRWNGPHL